MKLFMMLLASVFAQNMTPTGVQCTNMPYGLSGSWTGSTIGGSGGFGGSCGGVSYNALTAENMLIVNVPGTAPPGGSLSLDTCNGTSWDTELIVSNALMNAQCPSSASLFTCAAANDDSCGMQSRISIPATPGSSYAVLVTGFGSSAGAYTLSWNYGMPTTSPSTGNSRSNTPSTRGTLSSSFTPRPSTTPTSTSSGMMISPSSSVTSAPSYSSSFTMGASETASHSMDETPSHSSSFTPAPSFSSSPSMAETRSMTNTRTETPSSSQSRTSTASPSSTRSSTASPSSSKTSTASPSNSRSSSFSSTSNPSRSVGALGISGSGKPENDPNLIGFVSMGVAFGVVVTLVVLGMYHTANKRAKQRRSVHLSPQIYFNNPPAPDTEVKNASFRAPSSPKKMAFEPMHAEC